VTDAEKILADDALCGKLTEAINGRITLVEAETGLRPAYWKACLQMPDDSVLELRVEPCPDGCGQVSLAAEACPELRSLCMTQTQHEVDGGIIIGALQVARERVTADTIAEKQRRRDDLKSAIDAMYYYLETGQDKPSAADLRELLGDPDDKTIREALQHWD
jgi:hypothetical protein